MVSPHYGTRIEPGHETIPDRPPTGHRRDLDAPSSWPKLDPPPDPGDRDRAVGRSAVVGGVVGAVLAVLVVVFAFVVWPGDGLGSGSTDDNIGVTSPDGPLPDLDVQAVLSKVEPSVAVIQTTSEIDPRRGGAGTGVILTADGLVLTNAHVVSGVPSITIGLWDGTVERANLVGSFPDSDVALLQIEGRDDLIPAELGSSDALQVGEEVVAIGNALNLGGRPTVTLGIVSALNRSIEAEGIHLENLIQTDAAINPGNSGGPLVDVNGQVVGINTAGIDGAQNIGFSIAIDAIRPLIEEIRSGGGEVRGDQPFLGVETVTVEDLTDERRTELGISDSEGLVVVTVVPGTAAATAGIEVGDVFATFGGTDVVDHESLAAAIDGFEVGDEVTVGVTRAGEPVDVTVVLEARG